MEKKLTNSDPLRKPADKHSIYPPTRGVRESWVGRAVRRKYAQMGRSPQQIGRKGLSNHRWIVGGKLCLLLNQYGLVVGWDCATANVADNTFQWLIREFDGRMIILSDTAFHAAEGDPANLKLCQRGEWEDRILVETVLSMLTLVCHFKKVMPRVWTYFQARLAFTMAVFNVLVQWHGLQPNTSGIVPPLDC